QGDDWRDARRELLERLVLGRLDVPPARHAEGADLGLVELYVLERLEQLELLRVGAGEPGLDELDSQLVELADHSDLLLRGQGHALALHAVAQSRVVEEYLSH